LTGLLGTVLLFSPHIATKADAPLWALAMPVVAAISYGFAVIFARRFRGVAAPVTAAGQLTASTIIMLPIALIIDRPWTLSAPPLDAVGAVLGLAIISTAVAYILFFRLVSAAGATNASLVTLLVPPSAILLGMTFLGERLGWAEWTGMLVIGLGLVILDGRLAARLAGRPT
jgi:drug/metabolite transporter (DMT)-like permease